MIVPLCTQYRHHKVKSGPRFFRSNQDFASFFVRSRRLKSESQSERERAVIIAAQDKTAAGAQADGRVLKVHSLSPPPSLTTRFPGPIRHRSDAARKARKGTSDRSITHSTTSHTRKDRGTFRRKTVQQRQMVNLRLRLPPVTAWKKVLEFIEGPGQRLILTLLAMVIKPVCSPRHACEYWTTRRGPRCMIS